MQTAAYSALKAKIAAFQANSRPGRWSVRERKIGMSTVEESVRVPAAAQHRFSFDSKPYGEGGFARVIRGRDNVLERDIAVKVLNPLATQFSPAEQERFRREARILARLSHPNIPLFTMSTSARGIF